VLGPSQGEEPPPAQKESRKKENLGAALALSFFLKGKEKEKGGGKRTGNTPSPPVELLRFLSHLSVASVLWGKRKRGRGGGQ